MKELRLIIAENIAKLRTEAGLTQLKFAEMLNYSDKAVSKWERGEALPDVVVLKTIADNFGVSVDYLLEEEHSSGKNASTAFASARRNNRIFFSSISLLLVFLVATVAFSVFTSLSLFSDVWLVYIYAIPVAITLALVFNCVWGRGKFNYLIVTLLMWSLILSAYLTLYSFFEINFWIIFIIGAPMQVILLFLPGISFVKYERKWRRAK